MMQPDELTSAAVAFGKTKLLTEVVNEHLQGKFESFEESVVQNSSCLAVQSLISTTAVP